MTTKSDNEEIAADSSAEADATPDVYKVGYGHPPKETRFQAGRSGNPKGRPKGAKNVATIWGEELNAPVTVTENGKRKRMAKRQAIIKQQVNKALGNDSKAAVLVVGQMNRFEEVNGAGPALDLSRFQDPGLIASIVGRIRLGAPSVAETEPSTELAGSDSEEQS